MHMSNNQVAPGSLLTIMIPAHPESAAIRHEVAVVVGDLTCQTPSILGDWVVSEEPGTNNTVLVTQTDRFTAAEHVDQAIQRVLERYSVRGAVWMHAQPRRVYGEAHAMAGSNS